MGAVFEVPVLGEGAGADEMHGHGPDPHGAGSETGHDDQDGGSDGERPDHPVERERGVQHLQSDEHDAGSSTDQYLHSLRFTLVGVVKRGAEHVEADVQQHPDDRGNEHGSALSVIDGEERDHRDGDHDEDGDVVESAQRGQTRLQPADPVDVFLGVKEVADSDHEQERAAERADHRSGLHQVLCVHGWLMDGQVDDVPEGQPGGELHDEDGQREPDHEDGDQDAGGHERLLPDRGHAGDQFRVDDSVVEAERHLKEGQDDRGE